MIAEESPFSLFQQRREISSLFCLGGYILLMHTEMRVDPRSFMQVNLYAALNFFFIVGFAVTCKSSRLIHDAFTFTCFH